MTVRRTSVLLAALAVSTLAACGGGDDAGDAGHVGPGSVAASGPAAAQVATISSTDTLLFVPGTVNAKVGTLTLTLGNGGQVPHDLAFDDKALGGIGSVGGGKQEAVTLTFGRAGTYDFTCTFHPGMDGRVVVS